MPSCSLRRRTPWRVRGIAVAPSPRFAAARLLPDARSRNLALQFALAALTVGAGTTPLVAQCLRPAELVAAAGAAGSVSGASTILAPGDLVRVTVWRKEELSGDLRIGADGALAHPLYQSVQVVGLPLSQAKERLVTFLRQYEASPQLVLEPLARVSVGGAVRSPNLYSLPPVTSVAQAVAQAGGPDERGRLDRVRLLRGGCEMTLDLTSTNVAVTQMPVQSGDQLFIGRRRDTVRDVLLPLISIAGSAAAIAGLFLRR